MVVYVDVLIFTNTIINYCILRMTGRLMHLNTKIYRVILSSFVSALFSLTVYLPMFSFPLSILIKAGVGMIAAMIAYHCHSVKEYLKVSGMTVLISLIFVGCFIAVFELFHPPNMMILNDVVYFEFHPLLMIALTAVIYLILTSVKRIFSERVKDTVVRLSFSYNNMSFSCFGKIDTACRAKEPFSGAPVIIVEKSIFDSESAPLKRVIPYQTIQGSSLFYAVRASAVSIDGKLIHQEIYIGSVSHIGEEFKAIINSEIIR